MWTQLTCLPDRCFASAKHPFIDWVVYYNSKNHLCKTMYMVLKYIVFFCLSFYLQNPSATRVPRRCRHPRESGRRSAARQARLSGVRVAWNTARQHNVFGQSCGYVVIGRHPVHNAGRTVSFRPAFVLLGEGGGGGVSVLWFLSWLACIVHQSHLQQDERSQHAQCGTGFRGRLALFAPFLRACVRSIMPARWRMALVVFRMPTGDQRNSFVFVEICTHRLYIIMEHTLSKDNAYWTLCCWSPLCILARCLVAVANIDAPA